MRMKVMRMNEELKKQMMIERREEMIISTLRRKSKEQVCMQFSISKAELAEIVKRNKDRKINKKFENQNRYKALLDRDGDSDDVYRQSLFFVIANNDDLYSKVNALYDFDLREIKSDALEGAVDLSGGSKALVSLAFHLFTGGGYPDVTISDVFNSLDAENAEIALDAIKLRYRI